VQAPNAGRLDQHTVIQITQGDSLAAKLLHFDTNLINSL
jgi:hypothetical protein